MLQANKLFFLSEVNDHILADVKTVGETTSITFITKLIAHQRGTLQLMVMHTERGHYSLSYTAYLKEGGSFSQNWCSHFPADALKDFIARIVNDFFKP